MRKGKYHSPMPPTLYLTPTLDTALEHALSGVKTVKTTHPLAPAWLLLPDAAALHALRLRLGSTIAVRLFQFYGLGQAILDSATVSVSPLSDTAVRRVVQRCLKEMLDEGRLTSFARVWDKPGFIQALVEWLREMKSQGIPPEQVQEHPSPVFGERDRQLADLYARYQAFLQARRLSDVDGLLWLAAEALEKDGRALNNLGGRLPTGFFVLGFDQFTPVQVRILQALAGRFAGFSIYLPWDAARPVDSLALSRMAQTRQVLEAALSPQVEALADRRAVPQRLFHLRQTLFENPSAGLPLAAGASSGEAGEAASLRFIAAPSREAEVRRALREIKALLQRAVPPQEIALLAPEPGDYLRLVETVADEYSVPVQHARTLGGNPAIAALLNLLGLAPDFPWRGTLDALRSPYIRQNWLSLEQVDWLERLSRERPVVSGRDQWRFALRPLETGELGGEDEDLGPPRLAGLLPPEELERMQAGLMAFFDLLTPPPAAGHRAYTLWLQETILGLFPAPGDEHEIEPDIEPGIEPEAGRPSLHLAGCCADGPYAQRDGEALRLALDALHRLVEAAELVPPEAGESVPWTVYRNEVLSLLPAAAIPPEPGRAGVRFAALAAGRWLSVDHLFVLGLSEGEFPRLPPPEVFYSPAERGTAGWTSAETSAGTTAGTTAGVSAGVSAGPAPHPLPLVRIGPAEEASLWWQVIGNCRRSLALLRPRLDDKGVPWLPSPYWEEVRGRAPEAPVEEIPVAALPPPEAAASPPELLVSLAIHGAAVHGPSPIPAELVPLWQSVQAAAEVLRLRQSWEPAPAFEGSFQNPGLQSQLARRYGPGHGWSASRLNRYGACPFSFFAQAALKLEARPDPVEGLDARQRGSLLHRILEKLYSRLTEAGLPPSLPNHAAVLEHLEACCDEVFPAAPERYGFRPGALWRYEQQELRRLLRALLEWECETNGEAAAWFPYRQEVRFGLPGGDLPALDLETEDGRRFRLHGVIDRLDRDAQGRLRLVDYKSGSTKHRPEDIRAGLSFQAPLYALAVELLDGSPVAESCYLHLPSRETSGRLQFIAGVTAGMTVGMSAGVAGDETVQSAVEQASAFVDGVRRGQFPAAPVRLPSGQLPCASPCEYRALCRTNRHAMAKAHKRYREQESD